MVRLPEDTGVKLTFLQPSFALDLLLVSDDDEESCSDLDQKVDVEDHEEKTDENGEQVKGDAIDNSSQNDHNEKRSPLKDCNDVDSKTHPRIIALQQPLSRRDNRTVHLVLDGGDISEVVTTIVGGSYDLCLQRRGYRTILRTDNFWLSDEIIDAYFRLLQHRDCTTRKTITFSIQFFIKWFGGEETTRVRQTRSSKKEESGKAKYDRFKKWGKKKAFDSGMDNIFCAQKLYFPAHLPGHWSLIEVNLEQQMVSYFDSMRSNDGSKYLNAVVEFLDCEFSATFPGKTTPVWRIVKRAQCPKQANGFDCGVFVCLMGDILSSGASVVGAFSQVDLNRDDMRVRQNILLDLYFRDLSRNMI